MIRAVADMTRDDMLQLARLSHELRAEYKAEWPSVGVGLEDSRPVLRVVVRTIQELRDVPATFHDVPVRARVGDPGVLAVGPRL